MINSHLLYQLSYRGMRRILLIEKDKSIALCDFQPACGRVWRCLPFTVMPGLAGV